MELEFIIGNVGYVEKDEDGNILSGNGFAFHGIDLTGCRRSFDGVKALIHSNKLTAKQKNAIRGDMSFEWYDESTNPIKELVKAQEWGGDIGSY